MDNSKINLNNLYTEKEIQDIKKLIPSISPLIISNIDKINKYPNISFLSKEKSKEDSFNQYINRNNFIELILEKAKLIFKEENNVILTKSMSYVLEEIQKYLDNSNLNKKVKTNKLKKNIFSPNLKEKIQLNGKDNYFNKISPNKYLLLNR